MRFLYREERFSYSVKHVAKIRDQNESNPKVF
jgi:hypothetical protein